MKWYCRNDRNNTAVWISLMTVLMITNNSATRNHHSRPWLLCLVMLVTVGALLAVQRRSKKNCA